MWICVYVEVYFGMINECVTELWNRVSSERLKNGNIKRHMYITSHWDRELVLSLVCSTRWIFVFLSLFALHLHSQPPTRPFLLLSLSPFSSTWSFKVSIYMLLFISTDINEWTSFHSPFTIHLSPSIIHTAPLLSLAHSLLRMCFRWKLEREENASM